MKRSASFTGFALTFESIRSRVRKPRIGGHGRYLAGAVGEARVEEGNRCTAFLFEIWTSVWSPNQRRKHNGGARCARHDNAA